MTFRNDDDKAFTNDPLAPSPDRFFNDGSYVTDENVRLVHRMCQFIERGSLGEESATNTPCRIIYFF